MARLWAEVLHQAHADAHSRNGAREDARRWLQGPNGVEFILTNLGWHPRRAQAGLRHALEHPPSTDIDPF